MFTKLCIVKVIVTILTMVYYGSGISIKMKLLAPYKPANCFLPENCSECANILLSDATHKIGAWYFNEIYKSCLPYILDPKRPNCCPSLNILPKTQKECEDMCGEPCTVTHANFKTEPGICMSDCFIQLPPGVPEPCKTQNGLPGTNCCPRGYKGPSFLREEMISNIKYLDFLHNRKYPSHRTAL